MPKRLKKGKKGIKQLLLKRVAVLISLCYILNPLHQQINNVLHTFAHGLTSPEYVIAHPVGFHHQDGIHSPGKHHLESSDHQHNFIDFVTTVIEGSDTKNQPDDPASFVEIAVDKHLVTPVDPVPKNILAELRPIFVDIKLNFHKGYLFPRFKPPQQLLLEMKGLCFS